jgi:hypothetical protein
MAELAVGSKIQFETAVPGTWTTVGEVVSIGGPNLSRSDIDRTHLNSPDGIKQYLPGFREGGDLPFTVNYDAADASMNEVGGLFSQFADDDLHNYRLLFPDDDQTTFEFPGYVKQGNFTGFEVDGIIRVDFSIKVAGAYTWDTAAP